MLMASERELIADIRDHRLAFTQCSGDFLTLVLVDAYNRFTSPTRMRTDREHRVCRLFARRLRRDLAGRPGWKELDSGRYAVQGRN